MQNYDAMPAKHGTGQCSHVHVRPQQHASVPFMLKRHKLLTLMLLLLLHTGLPTHNRRQQLIDHYQRRLDASSDKMRNIQVRLARCLQSSGFEGLMPMASESFSCSGLMPIPAASFSYSGLVPIPAALFSCSGLVPRQQMRKRSTALSGFAGLHDVPIANNVPIAML